MMPQQKLLEDLIARHPVLSDCRTDVQRAYGLMCESFAGGGKMLIAGNGGSAADSEHIVGELMKGFCRQRCLDEDMRSRIMEVDAKLGENLCRHLQGALPAIALTGHTALSTAYMNDVDAVLGFAQQVLGYGCAQDVFLGITTSGNSRNILYAMVVAKAKGMKTVALTGNRGGAVKDLADVSIVVPESETYRIQELHLPIYHVLCLMLEDRFFKE